MSVKHPHGVINKLKDLVIKHEEAPEWSFLLSLRIKILAFGV